MTIPGFLPVFKQNHKLIISWVLHCASFYIWYYLWFSLGWDPSGHICATLIALILMKRQAVGEAKESAESVLYYLLLLHSVVNLYYTAYIFHNRLESIVGYLSGVVICEMSGVILPCVIDLLDSFFLQRRLE